jgi:uncharacterized protein (DUF1810 family)
MPTPNDSNDTYNLNRFLQAQEHVYSNVLTELQSGHKTTHWMWFIFSQIEGLGHSATARLYAIKSLDEASHYLNHPVLGARLVECSEIVLGIQDRSITDIFGWPDDLKLKSSMTLFSCVANSNPVFGKVLDRYFQGERDTRTAELLG